nr:hypothetical protein 13 [Balneolaceae bacterium]
MKLLELKLHNFKGIREFSFCPDGQSAAVYGDNEVGKTTLFDAYAWLLTDKDSRGQSTSSFAIKTIEDGKVQHGLEYKVEGTFTHEDTIFTLTKIYQEKWVKKKGSKDRVHDGHTTEYLIDDVPKLKKEYDEFIYSIMPEQTYRLLSDPTYLAETMHWEDRRKLLTGMTKDYSPEDIIAGNDELAGYLEILDGQSHDNAKDRLNRERKKYNEQLEDIPTRIDETSSYIEPVEGLEQAKDNLEKLKAAKAELEQQLADINSGGGIPELRVKIQDIEADKAELRTVHQLKSQQKLADLRKKIAELQDKVDEIEADWRDAKRDYQKAQSAVSQLESVKENVEDDISEIKDREPEPANAFEPEKCALCERASGVHYIKEVLNGFYEFVMDEGTGTIREDDINSFLDSQESDSEEPDYEQYLEEFNAQKAEDLKQAKAELEKVLEDIDEALEAKQVSEKNAANMKGKLYQRNQALEKAQQELEERKQQLDPVEETDEWKQMEANQAAIQKKIDQKNRTKQAQIDDKKDEIEAVDADITAAQKVISQAEQNEKYRQRIAELNEQRKQAGEALEEAEDKLYVLEQYTQAEAEYISSRVNNMFDLVEWQLFEEQINGGIKPVCEALVDGVPFSSANTAGRIQAGIDIIDRVSKHLGLETPVWVDNAEGVSRFPATGLQLITLVFARGQNELAVQQDPQDHLERVAAESVAV